MRGTEGAHFGTLLVDWRIQPLQYTVLTRSTLANHRMQRGLVCTLQLNFERKVESCYSRFLPNYTAHGNKRKPTNRHDLRSHILHCTSCP